MIGVVLGAAIGCGLLLIGSACSTGAVRFRATEKRRRRLADLIERAGIQGITPGRLVAASFAAGLVVGVFALGVSRTAAIAAAFGAMAAWAPIAFISRRARIRRDDLRSVWPDVVDNITSSVRAGMSLPEALAQIGERGPASLQEPFARFATDYQAHGRFNDCLDELKIRLSDPVGDRLIEALRVARDVGGHDLGRLLRTFSAFLREDLRTRGEMESRQSWTVNGARLAVAAPWVLLGLLSLRPEAVAAYDTGSGVVVLAVGAALCLAAYRLMLRVARLPDEARVLR